MARTIDIHNTFYPRAWLDYLETRTGSPRAERTSHTHLAIYVRGYPCGHVDYPGHYDVEARIKELEKNQD